MKTVSLRMVRTPRHYQTSNRMRILAAAELPKLTSNIQTLSCAQALTEEGPASEKLVKSVKSLKLK